MNSMMTGAAAMAFAVAALFFIRFWRSTRDRLFLFFAISFGILALNRIVIGLAARGDIEGDYVYWIRLAAFLVMLMAILDKNRTRAA
jgi:hypothetical protein